MLPPLRILQLPFNVGGMASGLRDGALELGHQCDMLTLEKSRWGYPAGESLEVNCRSRPGRWWVYASTLARICRSYDVYVFNAGSTLLHYPGRGQFHLDLPLYRSGAKKVFLYQGCDARQKFPTMERARRQGTEVSLCLDDGCYGGLCNSGRRDDERRRAIEVAARHADHMFALNPDLLAFLPPDRSSFLPYTIAEFGKLPARKPQQDGGKLRIVHAPTERAAKGTQYLLAAIDALRGELGDRFTFSMIENATFHEARAAIAGADLLVDQLLAGWYGGISVEAMAMGVPVICHVDDEQLAAVPVEMAATLPILRANPFTIMDVLRRAILNPEDLIDRSERCVTFATRWHAPARVMDMLLAATGLHGATP